MNGASAALAFRRCRSRGRSPPCAWAASTASSSSFPTQDQLEESDLDLIVSGSKDAILMIEGFAREMPEDRMVEAILEAHR